MSEAEIVSCLAKCCAGGRKPDRVFQDFLDLSERCLIEIPRHAEAAASERKLAEDTPETAELWRRLRTVYQPQYFEHFAQAFGLLLGLVKQRSQVATPYHDNWDVLGRVYMDFGTPSKHSGQFFTPWNVALAMAAMTVDEELLHERIRAALKKLNVAELALAQVSLALEQMDDLLPLVAQHVAPLTVCDPACGSGVMLLAVAAAMPRWATQWGLIQYYGVDIDAQCVQMARLNLMLYGLNGWGVRWHGAGLRLAGQMPSIAPSVAIQPAVRAPTLPTGVVELPTGKQLGLWETDDANP